MKSMMVTDNGIGMDKEDAHLAFKRHATSKIKEESDLAHIHTLGFRGEALAAISSVAKITLKTRQKNQEGLEVVYHGGNFVSEKASSLNQGTIVLVEDLFYNTPARFKYIKSDVAERQAIIDIFDRLALANPFIRLSLSIDGKLIKKTVGNGDFYQLIDTVYGSKMTKDMTTFTETVQKMKLTGYLISPEINRSRKKDVSIFINGRYIKNYGLIQAVVDGYHSYLMVGKFPIALMHIEMDPSLLDVNVHPQKYEVKFVNESLLAYQIENLVQQALNQKSHSIYEPTQLFKSSQEANYVQPQFSFGEELIKEEDVKNLEQVKVDKIPDLEYVGVFSGTYLLFQNEDGLFMMDQHAAMERIRYEHYFTSLGNPSKTMKTMLIPHQLNATKEDLNIIKHYQDVLKVHGFQLDSNLDLIAIPTWIRDEDLDLAMETMVTMLQEKNEINVSILRDALAKDISCKGSIRANQAINQLEINSLLKKLRMCDNPYTCPHGRPTLIKLSHYEIEKMFKRVVS
jgi:DNA mismatch repair protein MutL